MKFRANIIYYIYKENYIARIITIYYDNVDNGLIILHTTFTFIYVFDTLDGLVFFFHKVSYRMLYE